MGNCLIYALKSGSRLQSNSKFVAQDKDLIKRDVTWLMFVKLTSVIDLSTVGHVSGNVWPSLVSITLENIWCWTITGPIPGRHQSSGSPMLYIGYRGMTLFQVLLTFANCQYVLVSPVCIYLNTTPNLCMWLGFMSACMLLDMCASMLHWVHLLLSVCTKHIKTELWIYVLTGRSNLHFIMIFTL